MPKISNIVNLKSGYANFVELKSAFESTENAQRMAMYRPTKAHRAAFERLCRGLYQPNDKKFYLLSGSYGTGKSHLSLMFANFLARSSMDAEMKGFYANYEKLNPEMAKQLKNIRKDGQYLVAICDYHSGRKFEDVVLRAVFEACKARGLEAGVNTDYREAERLLDDWEKKAGSGGLRNFYQDFGKALERVSSTVSVEQLRGQLKEFDSDSMQLFRAAFKEVMGGIEFQAQAGNIIPIIEALVKSKEFKERFKGLAILFDEFGFTLEKGSFSKDVMQGFMERICKNLPNVIFVGCIHKDFKAYADKGSQEDAAVMTARITSVDLLNEGIEEIIGAIVEIEKKSTIWKKEIEPKVGVFDQLVPFCKSLNLFPWIEDVNRIRQQVLEDIYGVHPMALSCLLKLSSEIGSDVRSTFTFFSGDVGGAEGSYASFIANADITLSVGKLNLYTVDRLYDFFGKELSLKNVELRATQRQIVNGYYSSLDMLKKATGEDMFGDTGAERNAILKTALIYQLCQIPTKLENIQFGLYCLTNPEQKRIENHVKALVKAGALFYRQQSQTYELAVGSGEDPYDLIDRYVNDSNLHPKDLVKSLLDESAGNEDLEFLEAKQYNLQFSEDKRFKRYFVRARDLGPKFWDQIKDEWEEYQEKPKQSFEGAVVYALCESEADLETAKTAAQTIPLPNIALAIPHEPQPFEDTLLRVKACKYYLPPSDAEKISAQTESRIRDLLENVDDGYLTKLQLILSSIASGENACWYGQQGKILFDKPKQSHKPADVLCEELFKKRCRIKHPDLNLMHDEKWQTGKNTALKQAVTMFLEGEATIIDSANPDNHGEKRYIEKVLLKGAGALKKTDQQGNVTHFSAETDAVKISDDLLVLKELCQDMAQLKPGSTFSVASFTQRMKNAPYGVGGTSLMLAFAFIIRAYGERLRAYQDSTKSVEKSLISYDDIVALVGNFSSQVVFEVKEVSSAQIKLIDGIATTLKATPLKHGEIRSVNSAYESLMKWWRELPPVAKILNLYDKSKQEPLRKLKEVIDGARQNERFELLNEKLPAVYLGGLSSNLTEKDADRVNAEFQKDVILFNSGFQTIRKTIAEKISELFGHQGDMVECEKLLIGWYKALNPNQRDPYRHSSEEAQQLLIRLGEADLFETKLLIHLAQDFSFGSVADWTSLHIDDFVAKIRQSKNTIEDAKAQVAAPDIKSGAHEITPGSSLKVAIPKGATGVIYSTNGGDPRKDVQATTVNEGLNLTELLGNKTTLKLGIRAIDGEGNASDLVMVELINKERKQQIQLEKDFFGDKASFVFPQNSEEFIAVVASLVQRSIEKGVVTKEQGKEIETAVRNLLKKKS